MINFDHENIAFGEGNFTLDNVTGESQKIFLKHYFFLNILQSTLITLQTKSVTITSQLVGISTAATSTYIKNKRATTHYKTNSNFSLPSDLEDVSYLPSLLQKLSDQGWSEENLKKLAGENFIRVFQKVEEVSGR